MTGEEKIAILKDIIDGEIIHPQVRKEVGEWAIKALSQQRTGHWEWVQYDGNPEIGNFHCSECRYIPASFNMSAQKLNYCPKCGAKMQ